MYRTLILFCFALASCGDGGDHGKRGGKHWDKDKDKDKIVDRRMLIEAAVVENGSVAKHLVTTGTLESEAQADITPEANGVVTRILVDEGESVEAGQLLAVLASPSLEAGADRAQVELQQARRRAEQSERLHEQGAISDTELQEAREALQTTRASYREATRSRGFANLVSPIAGTVAVRDVRLGELAGSAARAYQVVDLSRLRVIAQLPEKDLGLVKAGLPVMLQGAYDPDSRANGTIERISPVVDPTSGTVRVTIAVDGNTSALRPGQYVKVRIEVGRHNDVMAIPKSAIIWQDGSPLAWRVADAPEDEDEDDEKEGDEGGFFANLFGGDDGKEKPDPWAEVPRRRAEKAALTLGYSDPDLAEITSGLSLGDLIVVTGSEHLRHEAEVKLPGDPDPVEPDEAEEAAQGEAESNENGAEG
jgi:membrane fusion protein (multidrug efflux system)